MEFIIISGMSGAGKSRAADVLEDLGYYCVDNMPVALLPKFAELCLATRGRYERVALVADVREKEGFDELLQALDNLWEMDCTYRILYLETDVPTLVQRYKETRRKHPLAEKAGSIQQAVEAERVLLSDIRERADFVINTTGLTLGQLQQELYKIFVGPAAARPLQVNVMAFGFKYGIPIESDLVFDVRFLPNPYYVAELREKTGMDREVRDFIFRHEDTQVFLSHLTGLVGFLLPRYVDEGKHNLTIAVGCTGGKHRSVAIANALAEFITEQGHAARLLNRDVEKGV